MTRKRGGRPQSLSLIFITTYGRNFSRVLGPMPATRPRRSSTLAKGLRARSSTIRWAIFGPMPGSFSSSATDATLMSTGSAGRLVDSRVGVDEGGEVSARIKGRMRSNRLGPNPGTVRSSSGDSNPPRIVADAGDSIGERRADTRQLQELSAIGTIEIEGGRAKLERAGRRAEEAHGQKRAADAEQKGGGKLCRPWPLAFRYLEFARRPPQPSGRERGHRHVK